MIVLKLASLLLVILFNLFPFIRYVAGENVFQDLLFYLN